MKEKLIKKLEELKKQKSLHETNFNNLTSAREKCIATLNGTLGAIETVEDLLKEFNKEPDKK